MDEKKAVNQNFGVNNSNRVELIENYINIIELIYSLYYSLNGYKKAHLSLSLI